jgi:hypothetical protein
MYHEIKVPKFLLKIYNFFHLKKFSYYTIHLASTHAINNGINYPNFNPDLNNVARIKKFEASLIENMMAFSLCFSPKIDLNGRDYFIKFGEDGNFYMWTKKREQKIEEKEHLN